MQVSVINKCTKSFIWICSQISYKQRWIRYCNQTILKHKFYKDYKDSRLQIQKSIPLRKGIFILSISWLFWKSETDINKKPFYKDIVKIIKTAKYKQNLNEFRESEDLLHQALGLIHNHSKNPYANELEISQAKSYVFDSMADLAFVENKLAKASQLYTETMYELINVQKFDPNDNAILEISLKLSMIYAAQGKNELAEVGYGYCLDTLMDKTKDNDNVDENTLALYGMSLDAYAKYLFQQNKFVESKSYLEKAITIAKKVLTNDNPHQLSVLYNDLGVILTQLKELDSALVYFELAAGCANEKDLSTIYYNIGEVYVLRNNLESAIEAYENAIKYSDESSVSEMRKKVMDAKSRVQNKTNYRFNSKFLKTTNLT